MAGNIFEIHSLWEVLPHLEKDTPLFLDVDNTLLTSVSEFGSDRWERFMIELFVDLGMKQGEATRRACQLWKAVQTVSDIQLVEKDVKEIFASHAHPIFAITARDPELRPVTKDQLAFLGLRFSELPKPFDFSPGVYEQGVFYCGDVPKGAVLKAYAELHPCSKIVLVDDYLSHLTTAAEILTIPFVGLRYGHLDERKAKYQPCEITKLLAKLLTHKQASQFLRRGLEIE
jgi:hypothetical protein